ncbi:enoyl-CoA hydratase/isomerase family protein [Zooshikella harenae]|uniref:Enoyl-CoA hydratase/isomerase family protein n=1 Tax=Zooshikella harenae TaxID=2827238 RepID=A0ABS5ZCN7_9GAMM|nr:enoyl-CoA hydratase/isomerase family protein [Zooshikella harenae]MBU2711528.1 enoyl-CoA hydratase/isomerase family protein [Zooshikella harenae]
MEALYSSAYLQVTCRKDGVATLTLSRSQVHNAFDDTMIAELITQLQALAAHPQIRLLIINGEGKHFSAGADLTWMQRMASATHQDNMADAGQLATLLQTVNDFPHPVIGQVHGAAYGGAVGLVACCDIAVATPKASFCLSEVKLGLVPAVISPYVIQAIGPRAARRYFLTAESFDAVIAEQLGLVHLVCEADELATTTERFIQRLLNNGPHALQAAKQLIANVAYHPISPELVRYTQQLIADIRTSAEGQEGMQAFLTKRPPEWHLNEHAKVAQGQPENDSNTARSE